MKLEVGDKAPDLAIADQNGDQVKISDYAGKKLIVFFYPKDNTPGCTKEACSLRDNYELLQSKGFEILGVSADTSKKHQNFIAKYDLPFPLLADTEKEMLNAWGTWGRKKFMGREYDGIIRTTFIVDEEGKIQHIINKVKTGAHAEQILAELGMN